MAAFTTEEIMVLLGLVNRACDPRIRSSSTIREYSSNTGKHYTVDGRDLARKLLREAITRGELTVPGCFSSTREKPTDPFLLIDSVLTPVECHAFMAHFLAANPSWRGSKVADALSELDNTDSNEDVVVSVLESWVPTVPPASQSRLTIKLVTTATRFLVWAMPPGMSNAALMPLVMNLVDRARAS